MSERLDPRQHAALTAALAQLEHARLTSSRWEEVASLMVATAEAARRGEPGDLDELVTEISVAGFHAQVARRLGTHRSAAPAVVPAKASPVLPVVGVVCSVGIGALGFALGGGVLAAGTVALAVFVLGVALAGTHAANARRREAARPDGPVGTRSAGEAELALVAELRSLLA
jgi:hypothetical protein